MNVYKQKVMKRLFSDVEPQKTAIPKKSIDIMLDYVNDNGEESLHRMLVKVEKDISDAIRKNDRSKFVKYCTIKHNALLHAADACAPNRLVGAWDHYMK